MDAHCCVNQISTKYGEGNTAKLVGDIVNSTTQITEGISAGMGIDLKSLLVGALGSKILAENQDTTEA